MFKIGKEEEFINVNGGGYGQYIDTELVDQMNGFLNVTVPHIVDNVKKWFD